MNFELPWYIAGPLIGLIIPALILLNEKQLGMSSSLRLIASVFAPSVRYFQYDRHKDYWQLYFIVGIISAVLLLTTLDVVPIPEIVTNKEYGTVAATVYSIQNWNLFLIGGLLIGFGARYAGGCTAGHCIMGISLLSPGSIVATIGFFVGGLVISHFVLPYII